MFALTADTKNFCEEIPVGEMVEVDFENFKADIFVSGRKADVSKFSRFILVVNSRKVKTPVKIHHMYTCVLPNGKVTWFMDDEIKIQNL